MRLTADAIWALLVAVRQQRPLVHNITNLVAMNPVANALLALGASPAMVHSSDEVEDFVPNSQALAINLGTLYSAQAAASKLAAIKANAAGVPWILDPVGAGATPYRRKTARTLASLAPKVIRGNGSEILALAEQRVSGPNGGVDTLHNSAAAKAAAQRLAVEKQTVVAVTGVVDYVTDGRQLTEIHNGHPLMARVTGLGCSATAVIGAFLAVEPDAFTATVAGLTVFGVAGEIAAEKSAGPGSLQVALMDALYLLDRETFIQKCRYQERVD